MIPPCMTGGMRRCFASFSSWLLSITLTQQWLLPLVKLSYGNICSLFTSNINWHRKDNISVKFTTLIWPVVRGWTEHRRTVLSPLHFPLAGPKLTYYVNTWGCPVDIITENEGGGRDSSQQLATIASAMFIMQMRIIAHRTQNPKIEGTLKCKTQSPKSRTE